MRTVEIRHAEVVVRFQPWWGVARPYLEAAVGLGVLWHGDRLENAATGEVIDSHDEQRSAGVLFGATLGVDFRLTSWRNARETSDIMLTTGLRRWYTGPMERPEYVGGDDGAARASPRALLAMWMPFIGLSFSIDNRPGHPRR